MDYSGINFRNNLYVYTSDAYQGPGTDGIVASNNWYFHFDDANAVHWDRNQAGSGEPGLTDLNNGSYDLKSDGPLRGKGINLSPYYQVDFNGTVLPSDDSWDIGALQFR
jgi:hypothetical protein